MILDMQRMDNFTVNDLRYIDLKENLEKAKESLEKARDYHLQLTQSTRQVSGSEELLQALSERDKVAATYSDRNEGRAATYSDGNEGRAATYSDGNEGIHYQFSQQTRKFKFLIDCRIGSFTT